MVGLGARKSTKETVTPGLRDREKKLREREAELVSFLNCEAAGAPGSRMPDTDHFTNQ